LGGGEQGRRELSVSARQLDLTSLLGILGGGAPAADRRDIDLSNRQDLNNLLNSLPIFGGDGASSLDAQQPGEVSSRQLLGSLFGGILGGGEQQDSTIDTTEAADSTAAAPSLGARQLLGGLLNILGGGGQQDSTETDTTEATDSTTPATNVAARQDVATILDSLFGIPTDEDTRRRQLDVSTDLGGLISSLVPLGGGGGQEARDVLRQKLTTRQLDLTDLFGNIFDGLSSRGILPRQLLDPVDYVIGIIPPPLGVTPNDA
jgi:hypothetical protein